MYVNYEAGERFCGYCGYKDYDRNLPHDNRGRPLCPNCVNRQGKPFRRMRTFMWRNKPSTEERVYAA